MKSCKTPILQEKVEDAALSEMEKTGLFQSLEEFSHLFYGPLGHSFSEEHVVEPGFAKPAYLLSYRTSLEKRRIIGVTGS